KRKIASSLEQKGFSHSVVKQCLEAHSFIRELEDEGKKELQKRYEKLVRKYERKGLDPFEKKQKIIQALLSKGYDYSTVKNWMEQWENSNF
ncbi:MAG TPA: hypothetical protein DHN33_10905, partial [Eubacteriaceae bacterium]|nr:hypothetical protein [Eubacteriaceae bacterium]